MINNVIFEQEDISKILELYDAKTPISHIAKMYNVYPQRISNILRKYSEYTPQTLSLKNTRYFQNIDSHTKAYLLGFIAADGAIVKRELTITIAQKDRIILDVIKSELESTNDIQEIKTDIINHVRFTTSNNDLYNDLLNLGIVPQKSLIMKNIIENVPKEFRNSFILGYFDGDGSINVREVFLDKRYSRKAQIQIRATKEFALGIVKEFNIKNYYITNETMPSLVISSKEEILNFYNRAYKDSQIFLSRKRDKFLIALYRQINNSLYRELYNQHICQGQTISYSY